MASITDTAKRVFRRDHSHDAAGAAAHAVGFNNFNAAPNDLSAAKIKKYPLVAHYQGNPVTHVLQFKGGDLKAQGPGLSFFFRELNTSIAEVPVEDQELPFIFSARSSDFQDVTVQGIITYRVAAPSVIATRIDFTLDLETGKYRTDPKVKIESFLSQLAQEAAFEFLSNTALDVLVSTGQTTVRNIVRESLTTNQAIKGMGLSVISVTVAALKPNANVEKALQVPTYERLQEKADQATFDRRAKAVEKERTIQQNEQATQLDLAKRREALLEQERINQLKQAETAAETQRLNADASADRTKVLAEADAEAIRLREAAEVVAERERMELVKDLDPMVLLAVALQKLAENPPENLRTVVFGGENPLQVRTNADQD